MPRLVDTSRYAVQVTNGYYHPCEANYTCRNGYNGSHYPRPSAVRGSTLDSVWGSVEPACVGVPLRALHSASELEITVQSCPKCAVLTRRLTPHATAHCQRGPEFGPAAAVDSSNSTRWECCVLSQEPMGLRLDLGGSHLLTGARFEWGPGSADSFEIRLGRNGSERVRAFGCVYL